MNKATILMNNIYIIDLMLANIIHKCTIIDPKICKHGKKSNTLNDSMKLLNCHWHIHPMYISKVQSTQLLCSWGYVKSGLNFGESFISALLTKRFLWNNRLLWLFEEHASQ